MVSLPTAMLHALPKRDSRACACERSDAAAHADRGGGRASRAGGVVSQACRTRPNHQRRVSPQDGRRSVRRRCSPDQPFERKAMTSTSGINSDKAPQSELDRHGIQRVPADAFLWGGCRYSNARDALAAKRKCQMNSLRRKPQASVDGCRAFAASDRERASATPHLHMPASFERSADARSSKPPGTRSS